MGAARGSPWPGLPVAKTLRRAGAGLQDPRTSLAIVDNHGTA
ncbi:Uncharacterised protein [Bordetella pertussis]|nr:Uncharacterised protein [Bordetella pertussis]